MNAEGSIFADIANAFKRYASFRGVSSRREFFSWAAFAGLITGGLFILAWFTLNTCCAFLLYAVAALLLLPTLAVMVRRLHGTGRSGWWIIIWGFVLFGTVVYGFLSGYLLRGMSPEDTVSPFVHISFPIISLLAFGYSLLMLYWLASPERAQR